jgi:hypothetical protein
LLVGGLLVRNRERIDWEELAPAAVLFVMTLTAYRFVLFFGIALTPVLARILSGAEPPRRSSWSERIVVPAALAAAIALAVAVRPTHFIDSMPLEGVRKLREAGVKGAVFAHFPWGGPVIDAGYPDWVVAYDGRYYRYTPAEWRRYAQTVRGDIGPEELDRIYHPAAYLLAPAVNQALIAALRAEPGAWREIYADHTCVVFVRAKA